MPLLCLAFLAATSAESEPELDAAQLDDLLRELEPSENEYEAVSRAGRKDISCHQHLENTGAGKKASNRLREKG